MENCPLVLSDPNRRCRSVWRHDALVAGCCSTPVLALAGSDSYLANVRGIVLGHMSRDWLGLLADGYWQNQGSIATGHDISKSCTIGCGNSLGCNLEPKPQRPGNGRMGTHLRFRSGRISLPLFFL